MARTNHDDQHLAKLQDHYARHGVLPSYAGMCSLVGFSAKTAAVRLAERLEDGGYLRFAPDGKLAPGGKFFDRPVGQAVRAGLPESVEEIAIDEVSIDRYLVDQPSETVLVPVKGMSMKDAGILDGDLLVVAKRRDAEDGDFVIANVDGEFALKELKLENGHWVLKAHNEEFSTIIARQALEVFGVVTGVIRRIKRPRKAAEAARRKGGGK